MGCPPVPQSNRIVPNPQTKNNFFFQGQKFDWKMNDCFIKRQLVT